MPNVIPPRAFKASHTPSAMAIANMPVLGSIERQQSLHAVMVMAGEAASMLEQASTEAAISGRA